MENLGIIKRILVTGSEGYIGTVLMPMLIEEGYDIAGLDTCFYSDGNLTNEILPEYELIKKDIRDIKVEDLKNFDAIVHLAALSNDPLGKLDENLTYQINYHAAVDLARNARHSGVKRFIFSSSCSLYGESEKVLTENDVANPQTAYGKSKILAEKEIAKFACEEFSPIYLRNATAYGISPRMRFDIVVNNLAGFAKTEKVIRILGDGTPWRPLVHVKDICKAIIFSLQAPRENIHNNTFNIGNSEENYQIKTIAERIKNSYPECKIEIMMKNAGDNRNYIVSFNKAENLLKFKTQYSLDTGIKEIVAAYERCDLKEDIFNNRIYTRLRQIEYLLKEGKIKPDLRWTELKETV